MVGFIAHSNLSLVPKSISLLENSDGQEESTPTVSRSIGGSLSSSSLLKYSTGASLTAGVASSSAPVLLHELDGHFKTLSGKNPQAPASAFVVPATTKQSSDPDSGLGLTVSQNMKPISE